MKTNLWWVKLLVLLGGIAISLWTATCSYNLLIALAVTGVWFVPLSSWTILDIVMKDQNPKIKRTKKRKEKDTYKGRPTSVVREIVHGILAILMGVIWISYSVLHMYYSVVAFVVFDLWKALVIFFIPLVGDIMFVVECILQEMWLPINIGAAVVIVYIVGGILSAILDNK